MWVELRAREVSVTGLVWYPLPLGQALLFVLVCWCWNPEGVSFGSYSHLSAPPRGICKIVERSSAVSVCWCLLGSGTQLFPKTSCFKKKNKNKKNPFKKPGWNNVSFAINFLHLVGQDFASFCCSGSVELFQCLNRFGFSPLHSFPCRALVCLLYLQLWRAMSGVFLWSWGLLFIDLNTQF